MQLINQVLSFDLAKKLAAFGDFTTYSMMTWTENDGKKSLHLMAQQAGMNNYGALSVAELMEALRGEFEHDGFTVMVCMSPRDVSLYDNVDGDQAHINEEPVCFHGPKIADFLGEMLIYLLEQGYYQPQDVLERLKNAHRLNGATATTAQ